MAKQSRFAAALPQGLYYSLYIYKGLVRALESCNDSKKSFPALLSTVARKFMQGHGTGWHFSSKPFLILVSAERPSMVFVTSRVSYSSRQ